MDDYFHALFNLSYPNKDFYFVDNSEDKYWHIKNVIMGYGVQVDYVSPTGKRNNQILCECQNMLRHKALTEGYDYLFMVECDLMVTPNIIEKLMAYGEQVAVARYFLGTNEGNTHLIGTEIEKNYGIGVKTNRNIGWLEDYLSYGTGETRGSSFGFGCALFSKEVLSLTPFFLHPDFKDHADTTASFYYHENGIKIAIDSEIMIHYNQNWRHISNY